MREENEQIMRFRREETKFFKEKRAFEVSGDFYTPQNIAELLFELIAKDKQTPFTLYDPCCGSGSLLLATEKAGKQRLFGQTLEEDCRNLIAMNAALHRADITLGKSAADTLTADQFPQMKFDAVIANPPFNKPVPREEILPTDDRWQFGLPPKSNANFAWLQHIVYHLKENGNAAVIMPNLSLTSCHAEERKIRAEMLSAGVVEAILTLPPNLFRSTHVPCCIWLLRKAEKPPEHVLLADVQKLCQLSGKRGEEQDFTPVYQLLNTFRQQGNVAPQRGAVGVSLKAIEANDFFLSPNLYLRENLSKRYYQASDGDFKAFLKRLRENFGETEVFREAEKLCAINLRELHWEACALTDFFEIFGGFNGSKERFENGHVPLVDTKTVLEHALLPRQMAKFVDVDEATREKFGIRYGDFLMNRTSETVEKLGCCSFAMMDSDAVFSGYLKRLRPKRRSKTDVFYALCYFSSLFYRKEIERVSMVYTTRANLNRLQLKKINMPLPPSEVRFHIGAMTEYFVKQIWAANTEEEKQKQLSALREMSNRLISEPLFWKEIHLREDKK